MESRKSNNDILSNLMSRRQLSADGKDWITAALDPFHDFEHTLAGYPDACASQTVVSCYQYQAAVAKPAGAAGDWDAHIFTGPIAETLTYNTGTLSTALNRFDETKDSSEYLIGPLNIYTNVTGGALIPVMPVSATQEVDNLPAVAVRDLSFGNSRVIAMGFEIHNTTADIYRQGTITAYRQPLSTGVSNLIYTNTASTYTASVNGSAYQMPCADVDAAMKLKSSRTWEAKDGVYATVFQSNVTNPITFNTAQEILFSSADAAGNPATTAYATTPAEYAIAAAGFLAPPALKTMPFDTTGVFLTGLSNSTTLTVKLRVYVERAPGPSQPSLATLASPSACYDLHALELYAHAINALPVAVKVGENAKGDWWRAVLKTLKATAGDIGGLLNPYIPGAGLVGSGIQMMAGQIDTNKAISTQVADQYARKLTAAAGNALLARTRALTQMKAKKKSSKPKKVRPQK